jgi:hypothetical protein
MFILMSTQCLFFFERCVFGRKKSRKSGLVGDDFCLLRDELTSAVLTNSRLFQDQLGAVGAFDVRFFVWLRFVSSGQKQKEACNQWRHQKAEGKPAKCAAILPAGY